MIRRPSRESEFEKVERNLRREAVRELWLTILILFGMFVFGFGAGRMYEHFTATTAIPLPDSEHRN